MSIFRTSDYGIFKTIAGNRPLNKGNLLRLKASIEYVNLLEQCPIIVDKDFGIIEGQHRLQAAKELGVDVFYVVTEKDPQAAMVLLNSVKKSWGFDDWVYHWAGKGVPSYIKILSLSEELNRSTYELVRVFQSRRSKSPHAIKDGLLELMSEEIINEGISAIKHSNSIIDRLHELSMKRFSFLYSIKFKEAIFYFIKRRDVDLEELESKLILKMDLLRPCTSVKDYGELIFNIYNFGKKNKIESIKQE